MRDIHSGHVRMAISRNAAAVGVGLRANDHLRCCCGRLPPIVSQMMPDLTFLQRELMYGVNLQHIITAGIVLLVVLAVWNRIARANMKLPGK